MTTTTTARKGFHLIQEVSEQGCSRDGRSQVHYKYAIHVHREGGDWDGFYWVDASSPSEVLARWEKHGFSMTRGEVAEIFESAVFGYNR